MLISSDSYINNTNINAKTNTNTNTNVKTNTKTNTNTNTNTNSNTNTILESAVHARIIGFVCRRETTEIRQK